jgi:hypothetical protein
MDKTQSRILRMSRTALLHLAIRLIRSALRTMLGSQRDLDVMGLAAGNIDRAAALPPLRALDQCSTRISSPSNGRGDLRDVTGGVDVRVIGPAPGIDGDAVVDGNAGALGQGRWLARCRPRRWSGRRAGRCCR